MEQTRREKALIGARLRAAREHAQMSKDEAAEAAGVQLSAVDAWERGSTLPTLVQYRDLLAAYGTTGYEVLFGTTLFEMPEEETRELAVAVRGASPQLRRSVDILLMFVSRSRADQVRA